MKSILTIFLIILSTAIFAKKDYEVKMKGNVKQIINRNNDYTNHKLEMVKIIEGEENEDFPIGIPIGIEFDDQNNVFLLMRDDLTIYKISSDGELLTSFGGKGEGPGEFISPEAISIIDNKLFVSDSRSQRISVFDFAGNFINGIKFHATSIRSFLPLENGNLVTDSWFMESQEEISLFHYYDKDFNRIKGFATKKTKSASFKEFLENMGDIAVSGNKLVVNPWEKETMSVYEDGELKMIIDGPRKIKGKSDMKSKKSGDSTTITMSVSPISTNLMTDNFGNIYTIGSSTQDSENDFYALRRYNQEGKLTANISLEGMTCDALSFDNNGFLWILDSENITLGKYKIVNN